DLRPDGLVIASTRRGIGRASGGAFETTGLMLWVFGPDGRATHHENFTDGREVDALARFDELTAASAGTPILPRRAVRPNAATAAAARLDAARAARDADALRAFAVEEPGETIDHPAGATYDAAGNLASRLMLLQAKDLTFRHEPLATLGESLAL